MFTKIILTASLLLTLYQTSSAVTENIPSCVSDSLKIETDSINWMVIANNFGAPVNVNARIISYQQNSLAGYNAQWISYKNDWLQYTTADTSTADSSMTLRYTFKNCSTDSVRFNFLVRRDNYCRVTIDNNIVLLNDAPTSNTSYGAPGTQIDTVIYLDTCTHNIDVQLWNRANFSGGNGYGLFIAGWLVAKTYSLFTNADGCEGYSCCTPTLGIKNGITSDSQVKIYPNPSFDKVSIILPDGFNTHAAYSLQNNIGQNISQGRFNNKTNDISLNNLPNGIYILRIEGYADAIKIIKQ